MNDDAVHLSSFSKRLTLQLVATRTCHRHDSLNENRHFEAKLTFDNKQIQIDATAKAMCTMIFKHVSRSIVQIRTI